MKNFVLFLLLCFSVFLTANEPEWLTRLPFGDDYIYGRGSGKTLEEAQLEARGIILMQLSSQIEVAVSLEERSNANREQTVNKLDSFLSHNSLRGASLVEEYNAGTTMYVLMKYPADCGQRLMNAAIQRYESEDDYDSNKLIEATERRNVSEAVRLRWRLGELNLEDYRSSMIGVALSDKTMTISLYEFLPDTAELSKAQEEALKALGTTLLQELQDLSYERLEIIGHANPTGASDEEEELQFLSRRRAEIMAESLKASGLTVTSVRWAGGDKPVGDVNTSRGRGRNRRVEIIVYFE